MSDFFITLLTLSVVIIALLVERHFTNLQHKEEKSKLINALLSKTPQDFVNAELTDKVKIEQSKPVEHDIPIEDIPDEEYLKIITGKEATGGEDGQE